MDNDIEGKLVAITGASGGLGVAAARLLAAQGAIVDRCVWRTPVRANRRARGGSHRQRR